MFKPVIKMVCIWYHNMGCFHMQCNNEIFCVFDFSNVQTDCKEWKDLTFLCIWIFNWLYHECNLKIWINAWCMPFGRWLSAHILILCCYELYLLIFMMPSLNLMFNGIKNFNWWKMSEAFLNWIGLHGHVCLCVYVFTFSNIMNEYWNQVCLRVHLSDTLLTAN